MIFSHKYLIGQMVLFKNTNSYNLKSVLCPDCNGYGNIYIENSIEKINCKKCSGYGYKAMHHSNAKYNEFNKVSLGYIKAISVSKSGLIKYDLEPAKITEYNFRELTKKQVLDFYDVPNKSNFSMIYDVYQGDIKYIYNKDINLQKYVSNEEKRLNDKSFWFEFKDIFNIGDNVYCAYNSEIKKEVYCELCNNSKKLKLHNGKIVDCECLNYKARYEKIVRLLEGKIIDISYEARLINNQFNNKIEITKIFKLELNTPFLNNCKTIKDSFKEDNIYFSRSLDEAFIYCEQLEQKIKENNL